MVEAATPSALESKPKHPDEKRDVSSVRDAAETSAADRARTTVADLTDRKNSDLVSATRATTMPDAFPKFDGLVVNPDARADGPERRGLSNPRTTNPTVSSGGDGTGAQTGGSGAKIGGDGAGNSQTGDGGMKSLTVSDATAPKVKTEADGSTETTRNDGSVVKANKDGKVTEVRLGNGDTRTFEYGNDGSIKSLTHNDKQFKVKDNAEIYDAAGHFTGEKSPYIAKDGSFTFQNESGDYVVNRTDRTQSASKKDGSFVISNADGRVTDVTYPNGKGSAHFQYDADGSLTSFTGRDGTTLTSKDGKF